MELFSGSVGIADVHKYTELHLPFTCYWHCLTSTKTAKIAARCSASC